MTICPLCGNAQEHGDCEVCGKKLAHADVKPEIYQTMPELEPTLYQEGPNWEVERLEVIEDHCASKVEVVSLTVPGLLPHAGWAQPLTSNPMPLQVTCRYCGQIQENARLCQKCGRTLPIWIAEEDSSTFFFDTVLQICGNCGVRTPPGRCRDCGAVNSYPDIE
jgi:hypothetical protein